MLVDADGQALQRMAEEAGIAVAVAGDDVALRWHDRNGWNGGKGERAMRGKDVRLVGFVDFAPGAVEFQAVAIVRDMACLLYTSRCV